MRKPEMDDVRCLQLKHKIIILFFYCKSISAHGWTLINQLLNHTVYLSTFFMGSFMSLSLFLPQSISATNPISLMIDRSSLVMFCWSLEWLLAVILWKGLMWRTMLSH